MTDTPYQAEGKAIYQLLRKRASETEIQELIDTIHEKAAQNGSADPLVESTDAYVTAVCFIGAKSLSHVLSYIERCKERLLAIGPQSETARLQIIQSVVSYWSTLPGTAVNIIDKLLNYTIVTPESVVRWCLTDSSSDSTTFAESWRYEMLASTMGKVTNRVRQIVTARVQAMKAELPEDQMAVLDSTLRTEREGMRALFALIGDLLAPYAAAANNNGSMAVDGDVSDSEHIQRWATRWTRVFHRKAAVEETLAGEEAVTQTLVRAKAEWEREKRRLADEEAEREIKRALREKEEGEERAKRAKMMEEREEMERDRERKMMSGEAAAAAELDVAEEADV
jgi:nuclear cap-binding protein subunit 1